MCRLVTARRRSIRDEFSGILADLQKLVDGIWREWEAHAQTAVAPPEDSKYAGRIPRSDHLRLFLQFLIAAHKSTGTTLTG